jgi:hypothetical protein
MNFNQKRLYNIADASLKQVADDLKDSIIRDTTEFATRGFTPTKLEAFEALIIAFDETTTDEELRGNITTKVELKDALAKTLKQEISAIRSRVVNKFGQSSGVYNSFGFGELANLSDDELYRTAKRVVRIATSLLSELSSEGLTIDILSNITQQAINLDIAIDAVGEAEEKRDLQTQDRITKGNALYIEMVKLAGIGKSLNEFSNEAKYNDYVLIETNSQKVEPTEPTNPTS